MQVEENSPQNVQSNIVNMQPQAAQGRPVTLSLSRVSTVGHRKIFQVNKKNPLP